MVGVPAFLKWVCGPSARIGWPLPCLILNELMIVGPNMKTISAAVISAARRSESNVAERR